MMVKMGVKIKFISVLMRLVSRRGGSLNSSWISRQVLGEDRTVRNSNNDCNNDNNETVNDVNENSAY